MTLVPSRFSRIRLTRRHFLLAVIIASTILALAWTGERLGIGKTSVAAAFDHPPKYPGYKWTRNGQVDSPEELITSAGSSHCGHQSATFLRMTWATDSQS